MGHFVAVHHDKKEVVISVRGTSTFFRYHDRYSSSQLSRTGTIYPWNVVQTDPVSGGNVLHAAKVLYDDTAHLLEHFFCLPQHYKIVITGHSLGGDVASLIGILLRDAFTTHKTTATTASIWVVCDTPVSQF